MTEDEQSDSERMYVPEPLVLAWVKASEERQSDPHNPRPRGAVAAFAWLTHGRQFGPVTGEDREPVWAAIEDEYNVALATATEATGAAHDIEPMYARGVVDMLTIALTTDPDGPKQVVRVSRPERQEL